MESVMKSTQCQTPPQRVYLSGSQSPHAILAHAKTAWPDLEIEDLLVAAVAGGGRNDLEIRVKPGYQERRRHLVTIEIYPVYELAINGVYDWYSFREAVGWWYSSAYTHVQVGGLVIDRAQASPRVMSAEEWADIIKAADAMAETK